MDDLTKVMATLEDYAENDYDNLEGVYTDYRQAVANSLSDDALADAFFRMAHERIVLNDAMNYMAHHADDGVCDLARELSIKVNHLDSDRQIAFGYLLGANGPETLIINDVATPTKMVLNIASGASGITLDGLDLPADVVVEKWTEVVSNPASTEVMSILKNIGDRKFSRGRTRKLVGIDELELDNDDEKLEKITDL